MTKALFVTAALLALLAACTSTPKTESAPPTAPPQAAAQPAPEPPAPPAADALPASAKAYVCEMRCEVVDQPGKCPKCGMVLQEVNRADIYYSCACPGKDGAPPACCKTTSDKPGKCECGVDLKMHIKGDEKPATS